MWEVSDKEDEDIYFCVHQTIHCVAENQSHWILCDQWSRTVREKLWDERSW